MKNYTTSKQKIEDITAKLEQGVQDVFTSEKYINYLQVMSRFYNYSARNCLLIAIQCPEASHVAGFNAWKKFNRHVKKGATAIRILAPVPCKVKKVDEDGEEYEATFMKFKSTCVFDISQTEGEDLPTICDRLTGDVDGYADLLQKLQAVAPVPVRFDTITGGAAGYFAPADYEIVVNEGMSETQTIKTLVHEIAHAVLHNKEDGAEKDADRSTKEVQAESVAYTVCQYMGIDTTSYSFEYVAGWSTGRETKELLSSLETIRSTAADMIAKIAA